MATSKRFRSDFQRICRRLIYRIFGSAILFLYKHICFCCTPPTCLQTIERHVSSTIDLESAFEINRKNQTAYKTAHYQSNIERRRRNQLLKATLVNNNTSITTESFSQVTSFDALPINAAKTVRTLTWNPYDQMPGQIETRRQAARLSRYRSASGAV
jgi:hypothetical protein